MPFIPATRQVHVGAEQGRIIQPESSCIVYYTYYMIVRNVVPAPPHSGCYLFTGLEGVLQLQGTIE